MSKKFLGKFFILLLVVGLLFAVAPKQAFAQTVPYAPDVSIQKAADEIVNSQMTEGGWGSDGMVAPQTVGVIGSALIDAYARTENAGHLASINAAAAYLMTKTNNFSPADGMFAAKLDALLGGTTYTTFVKTKFFDKLADGTYGATGNIDTAEYIYNLYTYSVVEGTGEIIKSHNYLNSEDPALGLVSAHMCGVDTSLWIAAVKADLNAFEVASYGDDYIMAAKALYSLAFVGETFDPTAGGFASATTLVETATQFAALQNDNGSFWASWMWENEDAGSTSYAILAFSLIDAANFQSNITAAANWLLSVQNVAGYWEFWGAENYVSSAVSAQAVNEVFPAEVLCTTDCYVSPTGSDSNMGNEATPFATIQKGINTVATGGTVNVAAGTYTEQVMVNAKNGITIVGAGETATTIVSPDILTALVADRKPVVGINASDNVTIKNLTIDGAEKGDANYRFYGLFYYNSGGLIDHVTVKEISNEPLDGAQSGVAIYGYVDNASVHTLTTQYSTAIGYQKGGFTYNGVGLTAIVDHNTATGAGNTPEIAMNGFQIGFGANATLTNNTTSGNYYTGDPANGLATGILLYQPGNVTVDNNTVSTSNLGISLLGGGTVSITDNVVADNQYGLDLGNNLPTVQYNQITGSSTLALWSDLAVVASPNWWGSAAGPEVGDIEGPATYVPWCGEASCDTLVYPPVHNTTKGTWFNTIQAAVDAAADDDAITVAAGTYEAFSVVGKTGLTITGAGDAATIIAPTALINTGVGHKYTPTSMLASVFVNNSTGITIEGMAIKSTAATPGSGGANAIVFWNNSTGSIEESIVQGLYTINGAQTGQGIAVDGATSVLSLVNTDISGFNKNAIDVVDGNGGTTVPGNLTVNVSGGTITGAGPITATAQNGVSFWNRAGGVLGGSITGATISGFDYTPDTNSATGILAYGLGGGTLTVSGNTFSASEVFMTDITGTLDLNAILLANFFPPFAAVVGDSIMIPPTKLNMSPTTMTMDILGGEQVVEIMATDVENMTAYHMEVLFDHTKLQVVSVENGTLLNSTNTTVVEEDGKDLGNTTGRLKFGSALQAIGGVNYPVTGSGSLVKITFQPIDFGTTSFAIDGTLSRLVDWPDAFFIPYEVTGDADLAIVGFGPAVSFGYVAYDADPNGWLRGVSTDFTIVGADLTDATSLVVKLWGGVDGTTLLQTNTAILDGGLFDGFTGFTSPFDIFGNFDYATDGYWTNVPEAEYGQTVTPTCVEATATLAGGTVITKKYCADLVPGDRSLLLKGTIEPDGGTGQVPGGDPLVITNVNDTVSYLGEIEWYPAATGRTEGNRVGVEINAPTAFDTTGTTFTFAGTTYNWDAVNDGDNFVWIYPKVTTVPQQWDIVVAWGGNITQTFTVKVLETSTLNTPPLPTITSTDVVGPYIPGVPREFNISLSNAGGAYYALAIVDYQIVGVSMEDIEKFEYFPVAPDPDAGTWVVMGTRTTETYTNCMVSGVASVCGQFGWAPGGFGPFPADFSSNSLFRITFKNGQTANLPLTLTLKGKKLGTETDWTVLQTFAANVDVYENVQITGTAPDYYLVGDAGASTITISNPAGGAPYGNHIEFNLTIFGAATTDIASATCDYGIPFDVLSKLSPDGSGNLTGTLIGADGAFEVGAGFDMTIPCTMVFNTAKSYTSTSEMVYVDGANKYVVATNTATAVVYPKPAIVSTLLPGSFQQAVAKDITINVNNVGLMDTPNNFTLHLSLPEGTKVVYDGTTYTCGTSGCNIPVVLSAGDNALNLTVTFIAQSTDDVTISLVDPDIDPGRIMASITGPNVVHADVALVTGTVTMQGRRTYNYAKFTLTGTFLGYGPYPSTTSDAAGAFSFTNIIADEYTITTDMPRYLNIYCNVDPLDQIPDLCKKITLSGNDALNTLWLRAGNANWTGGDNIIDGLDASQVGSNWGGAGSTDLTINHGDVNFDNIVNIQDLALVGGNMDLTSAQAYGTTWVP